MDTLVTELKVNFYHIGEHLFVEFPYSGVLREINTGRTLNEDESESFAKYIMARTMWFSNKRI